MTATFGSTTINFMSTTHSPFVIGRSCRPSPHRPFAPRRRRSRADQGGNREAARRSVKRLQDWIKLPSIAAENLNSPEGAEYMAKLAKDAGFPAGDGADTDGKPGVFATLDAGAAKTVGLYFMYDVKQFDPKEWTSPPLEATLVDKPGLGKAVVGRGAVNQKGPESAFLAALHAIQGRRQKDAGEPGDGGGGRGGNWFAAHSDNSCTSRKCRRRSRKRVRRLYAVSDAGPRRRRHGEPWREGRGRAGAGFERRKMGTRPGEGHSFVAESDGR